MEDNEVIKKVNKEYMAVAMTEAMLAFEKREVPIGAVIVKDGVIIGKGHNLKEEKNVATSHAEILAIEEASKSIKNWRLEDCEMYVTLEPCPMCTGAIINARIKKLHIATRDKISGCCGSVLDLTKGYPFSNKDVSIDYGICEEESTKLLKDFFKNLRESKG